MELTLYPTSSRYHGLAIAEATLEDGRTVRYLRRRFLPDPENFVTYLEYRVTDGDRLDNLAARFLGDPLASWRIADANRAMRPEELVEETGRIIDFTLPEGIQENPGA